MKNFFVLIFGGSLLLANPACAQTLNHPSRDPGAIQELKGLIDLAAPQEAEKTVGWEEAGEYVGKVISVKGVVVNIHNSGKACFLNFTPNWKGQFHLVMFAKSFPEFAVKPEEFFLNREILVTGKVGQYKGTPQIILESPRQIHFLDGGPKQESEQATSKVIPATRIAPAGTVSLVSWNVENFYDHWDDPFSRDQVTKPAYVSEARMKRVAQVLKVLYADVVCLQEIENRGVLQSFVDEHLCGMGYEVVLVEGNDTRGIDVAILSRIPVGPVTSYRHLRFQDAEGKEQHFQRDLLQVRLEGDFQADVFVVHLKSQYGAEAADLIREAEATAIAKIVKTHLLAKPRARLILTGDFNEVPEEKTLAILTATGMVDLMAKSAAYTYNQEPYLSRIDYVMASPSLAPQAVEIEIIQAISGLNLEATSDHYPLLVRFALQPQFQKF